MANTVNGKKTDQKISFGRIASLPVDLTIEIGKAKLTVEELMSVRNGDVIALNKLKDEPFDIKVNGQPFAEGKVVVDDDRFYMKVTRILERAENDQS